MKARITVSDHSEKPLADSEKVKVRVVLSGAMEGGYSLDLHRDEVGEYVDLSRIKPKRKRRSAKEIASDE